MREVVIVVPDIDKDQNIEIDVHISGKNQSLKYRIELLNCEEKKSTEERITVLRHKISEYDKNWELVEIGAPEQDQIPIMFRKHNKSSQEENGTTNTKNSEL